MNIAAVCLRAGGILGTALLLTACVEPVLEGPNYPAEDPPWIASGYQKPVGDIEIARRLILIGDAGLHLEDDPTLAALGEWSNAVDGTTVLFLGDNIYDDGLTVASAPQS